MRQPAAVKLDARFSDPRAVAPGWEEVQGVIEAAELFWICTVRHDGRPHVTPLVAVWVDDAIHFCTGAREQKAVNLRANPHVVLTTGCNQWDRGLDVVIEGDAVQVTDERHLERLAAAWAKKWDGRWKWEVRDGGFAPHGEAPTQVFSVRPKKVFAHSKGDPFGATTIRFE